MTKQAIAKKLKELHIEEVQVMQEHFGGWKELEKNRKLNDIHEAIKYYNYLLDSITEEERTYSEYGYHDITNQLANIKTLLTNGIYNQAEYELQKSLLEKNRSAYKFHELDQLGIDIKQIRQGNQAHEETQAGLNQVSIKANYSLTHLPNYFKQKYNLV